MVQRSLLGLRFRLRYVIALVFGAILTYTLSRRFQGQIDVDLDLAPREGTPVQGDASVDEQSGKPNENTGIAPIVPPSSPEQDLSLPADQASLHVVISHFEEDPFYVRTWLDDLRAIPYVKSLGLHVTIYTKGSLNPEQIRGRTAAQEVIQLPNVGREGSSFLHHILKNYENPPPFTLFTQAYLKKVQQEGSGERAGHFTDWIIDRLTNRFDNATGFMSMDRKHDICYCGHCTDGNKDFYPLWPQLYTLITGRVCRRNQPTILSFNGHFIASRKRILARPKQIYEYLQELVDAPEDHWVHSEAEPKWFNKQKGRSIPSNPKFGHTLERLWHTLFACDSPEVVEDCEIEGLKVEDKGGSKASKRRQRKEAGKKQAGKEESETSNVSIPSSNSQVVRYDIQQWVLDVFKDGCSGVFDESLSTTIQEIKQHLFERDFISAFSKPEYLEAYAARWSPTRALCYLEILLTMRHVTDRLSDSLEAVLLSPDTHLPHLENTATKGSRKAQKVVFLGAGGGAELVAFAGLLRRTEKLSVVSHPDSPSPGNSQDLSAQDLIPFNCVFVDAADWSPVLSKLHSSASATGLINRDGLTLDQRLDTYAVTPLQFSIDIKHHDILKATREDLASTIGDAIFVTLMFTLNELYSTSLGSTMRMLLHLTSIIQPGALLLVVDSPGSYSTVDIGKSPQVEDDTTVPSETRPIEKCYPMQWLLNHTLLESATILDSENHPHKQWTRLESEESKWFRLPRLQKLQYPLELEDMRYQMHLYQRI